VCLCIALAAHVLYLVLDGGRGGGGKKRSRYFPAIIQVMFIMCAQRTPVFALIDVTMETCDNFFHQLLDGYGIPEDHFFIFQAKEEFGSTKETFCECVFVVVLDG